MDKALKWLLVATFFKELVWVGLVPLWHFPDEQAHWATVQIYGEIGSAKNLPTGGGDLAEEILISERLLGTERDRQGNNKFTYHPEYRIEYTETSQGKYEQKIINLPKGSRTRWTKSEAAHYPPMYYWLSARIYRLVYEKDLLTRVFTVRAGQSLLLVGMVYLAWKIGELVFAQEKWKAGALAWLVSWHPMLSFVGAGVNSDNLFNFWMTAFLYWGCLVIKKGLNGKRTVGLIAILVGGLLTKPQMMVAGGLTPVVWGIAAWKQGGGRWKRKSLAAAGGSLGLVTVLGWWAMSRGPAGWVLTFVKERSFSPTNPVSLWGYLKWTAGHTIREVVPWYWGVFNWLGVTLPRWVNRVQARLLIVAAVGVGAWGVLKCKVIVKKLLSYSSSGTPVESESWDEGGSLGSRQARTVIIAGENTPALLWLWLVAGVYFAAVTVWDWLFTRSHGFSFGIQGRYFFPMVVAQMSLVLVGVTAWVPKKWEKGLLLVLCGWWGFLSLVAMVTVAEAYYDLSSLNTFLLQMSQYKPLFFKAPGWLIIAGGYLLSLVMGGRELAEASARAKS